MKKVTKIYTYLEMLQLFLDCNSDFGSYDDEDYDLGLIQDENSAKEAFSNSEADFSIIEHDCFTGFINPDGSDYDGDDNNPIYSLIPNVIQSIEYSIVDGGVLATITMAEE